MAHAAEGNKPVILMGDFNTLSPNDADCYEQEGLVDYLLDVRVCERVCVCVCV